MRIGVVFPQTEIGSDVAAVRDYAQAAEGAGFEHLLVYDHVIGANPERPGGWRGPYTHESLFHEPFVLFGYLAAVAPRLELVTGILIAPQRETVLIAKQAAEVDVLTNGKLRLGIGIGWNAVEYEALNQNFHNRGKRVEEQIEVLRALWTQPLVNFKGRWHSVPDAGLKPLPVQRPIPIWMGGTAEAVIKRVARLADGWFPQFRALDADAKATMEQLHGYIRDAGRRIEDVGIEGRVNVGSGTPDQWVDSVRRWQELGATHLSVNTMGAGLASPAQHIDAIRRFKDAVASVAV